MNTTTEWHGFAIIGDTIELEIESESYINLDYDDIIATLSTTGNNYVASGIATSFSSAFKSAIGNLPTSLNQAKRLLIHFVCGNKQVDMTELRSVTEMLNEASSEISMRWGITSDPSLDKDFKVIILLSE